MMEAVSKIAKLPSTFLFPFAQWPSSCEHMDYSTEHIWPEELAFSLSVGGDKLQVLFISPKGLCIWNAGLIMRGLLNVSNAIREKSAILCWDSGIPEARSEHCICCLESSQTSNLSFGLVWFIVSQWWVCTCRNQTVRSDGKAHPQTYISRVMAQSRIDCKLFCHSVILDEATFCQESSADYRVRAEAHLVKARSIHRCS